MNRAIALAGLLSVVMLAACSKPAPTDEDKKASPAAVVEPAKPQMGRAEYLTDLLGTIDTTPQCQPFRDQLEQVRDASSDALSSDEMNQANGIAGKAYAAGCLVRQ
jgi:PBP1b-binding outer membrane lipoprotein LpoB